MKVHDILANVEREHNVKIIYAVEAGRREWYTDGAAQRRNTEFDIRFIYMHKNLKSYVSVNRNATTESIDGYTPDRLYDWCGFDITKALRLLNQMNPVLVEMIYASNVYKSDANHAMVERVRDLVLRQYRIVPLMYQYRWMGLYFYRNLIGELRESVSIRNYFSVIRPFAMIEWLLLKHDESSNNNNNNDKRRTKLVENNFNVVMDELRGRLPDELHSAIMTLLDKKKAMNEMDEVVRVECVDEWIQRVMSSEYDVTFARVRRESKSDLSANFLTEYDSILHSILNV